jgi:hypothetical protein
MSDDQQKTCEICGAKGERIYADHNHNTGLIRGFLCPRCNALLGNARDNIEILKNAVHFLETHFHGHKELGTYANYNRKRSKEYVIRKREEKEQLEKPAPIPMTEFPLVPIPEREVEIEVAEPIEFAGPPKRQAVFVELYKYMA